MTSNMILSTQRVCATWKEYSIYKWASNIADALECMYALHKGIENYMPKFTNIAAPIIPGLYICHPKPEDW